MKLNIKWNKPITLVKEKNNGLIYSLNLDKIPDVPGIYIFGRLHGATYEALYVGKSGNLRKRMKQHLNNLKLMKHLEKAKTGERIIITGQAVPLPGQQLNKIIRILERAFISHFLEKGDDLINIKGITIRRHEINSEGPFKKTFIPPRMYLEAK